MKTNNSRTFVSALFSLVYNLGMILGGSKWEKNHPFVANVARLVASPVLLLLGGSILATISLSSSVLRDLVALACGAPLFSLGFTFAIMVLDAIVDQYTDWRWKKTNN